MNLGKGKIVLLIGTLSIGAVLAQAAAHAQTAPAPTMVVTWRAEAYAPSSYQGKILPPREATVHLALELLENNKLIPVSDKEIRWSSNDQFVAAGVGLANVDIKLNQFTTRTYRIKTVLKDYQGRDFETVTEIRRTDPRVVIEAPYPNSVITDSSATVFAVPYFFLIQSPTDFMFDWTVQGQSVRSTLAKLSLDLHTVESGRQVTTGVTVTNRLNELESTAVAATFTVKR